jgi:hypothetical protein
VSTTENMIAVVEIAFLILTQAIIVLIRGRSEAGANLEEGCVSRAAVVENVGIAILVVGDRHLPPLHANKVHIVGGFYR